MVLFQYCIDSLDNGRLRGIVSSNIGNALLLFIKFLALIIDLLQ